MKSNVALTSADVTGLPSLKWTSLRRWKIHVKGSGVAQDSARSPCRFIWESRSRRLEKRRPSMCCEAASVAKRGSRLVGFDSRRNVRALELVLALEEHETKIEATKQRSNEVTKSP